MKVTPVIDILNGVAVHATRGKRSEYKPLQTPLSKSANPTEVALAFKKLGFTTLYIADLDAIIDCSTDFGVLKSIVDKTCMSLMVDAGITSIERAQKLLETGVSKLVIGTETLTHKSFVSEAITHLGSSRVVVSLDLKSDRVLLKPDFDGSNDPMILLREFKGMGVSEVIVLDLDRVGSGEGVNVNLLKRVIGVRGLGVYVGGGVRGIDDLLELDALGISNALVATALHIGKISIQDLKDHGFL